MTTNIKRDLTLTKQLHILTLNINGLQMTINGWKLFKIYILRTSIQPYYKKHPTPGISPKWEKEWKDKSLWHSGPIAKSSAVAILFKENLKFQIINSETDLYGRILKCIIQIEKQLFQIINIYAPTKPIINNFFTRSSQNLQKKEITQSQQILI